MEMTEFYIYNILKVLYVINDIFFFHVRTEIQAPAGPGGLVAADQHRHVQRPGRGGGGQRGGEGEGVERSLLQVLCVDTLATVVLTVSCLVLFVSIF